MDQHDSNMILGLARRRRSRIILLLAVVLFLFLLYRGTFPSLSLGFGTPAFPTSHEPLRFKASSVDWADAKLFFPRQSTTPLPRGQPKILPRVQATHILSKETKETRERRAAVKDTFLRSWNAYKEQAWTWDELRPVSGSGKNTFGGWAATLVDSLDTLWMMGCVLFHSSQPDVSLTDSQNTNQVA